MTGEENTILFYDQVIVTVITECRKQKIVPNEAKFFKNSQPLRPSFILYIFFILCLELEYSSLSKD